MIETYAEVEEGGGVAFDGKGATVGGGSGGEIAGFEMSSAFFEKALRFFFCGIKGGGGWGCGCCVRSTGEDGT